MGAPLRLASVFSDHMVLCRNHPIRIFGDAVDGARVHASLNGRAAEANARDGRFELTFAPMPAGGPYLLTVTDGQDTKVFTDVLLGDVYLAGGQSNMEMELKNTDEGAILTAETDNSKIRFCAFPKQPWLDERALALERETTYWRVMAPGACGEVSAVAYHFAVSLQAELGVPVGIIGCYWGGTSITCWLDESALLKTAAGTELLTGFHQRIADQTDEQYEAAMKAYEVAYTGWVGRVDAMRTADPGITWVELNECAGVCPWPQPEGRRSGFRPAGLVNTMVKRIAPYTLTGILYYQGEEDTSRPALYKPLMMSLVCFWRTLFRDPALPFLFAQLPMYIANNEPDDARWAVLREAQEQAFQNMRNTGLVVLIDCGEFDNIHPTDKKTVGQRFFLQARKVVYGLAGDADSPRAQYALHHGHALTVQLDAPVCAQAEPTLFELADEGGVFKPAKAVLDRDQITLTADGIAAPIMVRYAWLNYGRVNVFGANGLPLAPFRLA